MVAGQRPLVLRLARRARLAQRQAASGREEIGAHWLARLVSVRARLRPAARARARARVRVRARVMIRVRVRCVHWLARLGQSAAVEVTAKDHLVHLVKGKRSEASAPTPTLLATPTPTPTLSLSLTLTLALSLRLSLSLSLSLSLTSTWDCMCGCILRFCRETSVAEALPWLASWKGVRSSALLTSRSSCCLCSVLLPSTRRLGGSALGGSGESMSSC